MTSAYQESTENGHHITKVEHSDTLSELSSTSADSTTEEQGFKNWRIQLSSVLNQIRKATNLEELVQLTTAVVKEKIQSDRVMLYRFNSSSSGVVLGESIANGWTPAMGETIPAMIFGLDAREEYLEAVSINDIKEVELTAYKAQILEKFQVTASLSIPIFVKDTVWGLLGIQNCVTARQWEEREISLLSQVSTEISYKLESFELEKKLEQQAQEFKSITKVIDKIQLASSLDKLFRTTTQEVRELIKCDRLAVYRFDADWSGEFVAESVANGWVPLVGPGIKTIWEDTHLQETKGGRYRQHETLVANDIYEMNHAPCHVEILEQFQVKAYVIVPLFAGQKLWGLLGAYQNSGTYEWQEDQVKLLRQIAINLGVAVSQAEFARESEDKSRQLAKTAERQQSLITLTRKIGEGLAAKVTNYSQFNGILQTTVYEVRRLLGTDRTVVYRFNEDWSGDFIAESVGKNWKPFAETEIDQDLLQENGHCDSLRSLNEIKNQDTYLQDNQGGRYKNKTSFVVNDVEKEGFPPCYKELLDQFEAKAYLTVPIFHGDKLWGLLASYQHGETRHWEEFEVTAMEQIAVLLAVAMQQSQTLDKYQEQSKKIELAVNRDRALSKVIDKIRQSLDIDSIFLTTTQEMRALLKTDRVAVYRLNPDYSGEFVAESISPGWLPLVDRQHQIRRLQESVNSCTRMRTLFQSNEIGTSSIDPYLQTSLGSKGSENQSYVVSDIYAKGFNDCYLQVLEQYQCKAYAIVPIYKGQNLWGMLAAYQNDGPREWEDEEVKLLTQISNQLSVALQQVEFLQQLQTQSSQVAEAAAREKQAREYLQTGAMKLLSAVRPALNGDLTVRAPITEDELGTIADAYNNTLQALRQIVLQVQAAAQQVAETSGNSNISLNGLTDLAQQQSREISGALTEIQQMVDSTQEVVANAESVQVAVQKANQTVDSGDAAMNMTVEAIQGIRETVSQTSKKIKRLSESSQKISKVVNLISNFATQTNVLALNAAIEATRAGEYGKGFAVVADEVRSLSRQSAAATIEIEKLVQEIQEETGEVAVAMETGIQQVVEGTNLVNETRQNLNDIVHATAEISELLQRITDATQTQMLQSVSATASMKDVAQISQKTSTEANSIASVFQQLSEMGQELLASVSKFKVN
ncbi:methyl-accepting chemotaxis sensory transducer with phytochrome sensor [Calothrix parasitica NIES-267]|uniref:Methyl-accepting chemotaxis sensory transducer with phytochrome sensor n=1 Tax=Calothrix parasitica NIES-267 TaxID=1973488 RepID=A0A1Z4LLP4_9CYAN|nr:methyl-accepting chemotaxis sensory transducer with phytochrome sensor [Calothrix parasitica NIES-267]